MKDEKITKKDYLESWHNYADRQAEERKLIKKLNNGGSVKATDLARSMGIEVIEN